MYDWLSRRLPRPLAGILCAMWYSGLMVAVVLLTQDPVLDFNYLHG